MRLKPCAKYQCALSGGRTSAYMLHLLLQHNDWIRDSANFQAIFTNTGREMPETLDFIDEIQRRWNINITWLEYDITAPFPYDHTNITEAFHQDLGKMTYKIVSRETADTTGLPFLKAIARHRILPTPSIRYCTLDLKTRTAKRYIKKHLNWKKWHVLFGFRADEAHRLKSSPQQLMTYDAPLIRSGVNKWDVLNFWAKQPFDLRLPADSSGITKMGNCDNCFLKSEAHKANLCQQHPERYEWWLQLENGISKHYGKRHIFHKQASLQEIADYADGRNLKGNAFLCQEDGGECI